MNKTYMLDTCICSFIMREQPEAVLKRLEQAVLRFGLVNREGAKAGLGTYGQPVGSRD